jgi:hypothetical protein
VRAILVRLTPDAQAWGAKGDLLISLIAREVLPATIKAGIRRP